ncbi:MAG TPA: sulfur transferase domain-containing protein [Candidatus Polarisedimenticolia bacterium]|nr:sulfur transferase domain-containing protein [Candidatus Polarisedimenticolia bacterium]
MNRVLLSAAAAAIASSLLAAEPQVRSAEPQVRRESVAGITNLARLGTTVACAGAVTPAAIAEVKKMGYKAVFNLRLPDEPGADIEAEAAAARASGLSFVHLPLNSAAPDTAIVDRFLQAIADPANQPAFIHCHSGSRAAALWLVKRVMQDGWSRERAEAEASELGTIKPATKQFALDYLQAHGK